MNHKTTVFLSKCSKTHVQQCGGKKKFYACGELSSPLAHQLSPPNTGIVDETLIFFSFQTPAPPLRQFMRRKGGDEFHNLRSPIQKFTTTPL